MSKRSAIVGAVAAVVVAAAGGACTSKDTTYCDEQTPCTDPDFPVCNLQQKLCERAPQTDAGADAPRDGAGDTAATDGAADGAGDAAGDGSGGDDGGGAEGGQTDAPLANDGGCEFPQHECGGHCYALDDPAHCGASCAECTIPANGSATCDGTSCGFTCNGGYWKNTSTCDACTTAEHCGASCVQCTSAPTNGHPTCDGTDCGFECNSGYWKDGAVCTRCDTIVHCGPSCVPCTAPAHGQATCDGTSCDFVCDTSWWHSVTTCEPCNTSLHCGQSCVQCTGMTPDCQGGQGGVCVCNATSCGGLTPVCNTATGTCRACTAHEECASAICDDNGSCVAEADIIYLGITSCADSGPGNQSIPFCTLAKALATAKAGPRHAIFVRTGVYHATAEQDIDTRVIIVGTGADQAKLTQDALGVSLLHVQGSGNLSVTGVGLIGSSVGHALKCDTPSGGGPWVTIDRSGVVNGGGMGIYATQCTLTVTRSIVDSNTTYGLMASNSHAVLRQTKFTRNGYAGLVFAGGTFDVENCLIAKNGAATAISSIYGGVRLSGLSGGLTDFRFVNNTVADNTAPAGSAAAGLWCDPSQSSVWLQNLIVYGNSPGQIAGECYPYWSDVQGVAVPNPNGNINGDPRFASPSTLDYHLSLVPTASPCINGGDPSNFNPPTVDLDGYPRSGNPDMGCYEAH